MSLAIQNAPIQRRAALLVAAAATVMASASGAHAQAPAANAPDNDPTQTVTEIVVTAEKHATSVMKSAIAVTALSGDELTKRNVRTAIDLQQFAPALSITNAGLVNNVNIRGIGLNLTSPSVVSGVGTYRDSLYQAPIVAGEPYYDLSNVQVLRGPQGTFLGNSTTGGAVYISSMDPQMDEGIHGYFTVRGGNYRDYGFEGAVNSLVSDQLAVRAAFTTETRDSFFKNATPAPLGGQTISTHPGDLNVVAGRLGVRWNPNESFELVAKAEYYQNNTDGLAQKPIPGSPLAAFAPSDPFTLAYSIPVTKYDEKTSRFSADARYHFANGITLRSISGVTNYQYSLLGDGGASTQLSQTADNDGHEYVASEELTLLSPDQSRLRWVIGAYLSRDPTKVDATFRNYAGLGPATTPTTNIFVRFRNVKYTEAGFVGLRYRVTDTFELQAGGRYSWNQVRNRDDFAIDVFLTSGPGTPASPFQVAHIPGKARENDDGFTWKLAANWDVTPNNFLYAFAATGMKAGGIQDGATTTFQPEHVTDYEAGWKAFMFDRRVRSQLSFFHNNYSDYQLEGILPLTGRSVVFNSGRAKSYGVEAELTATLGAWQFNAVGAYLHTRVSIDNLVNPQGLPDGGAGTLGPQCSPGQTVACFNYAPFSRTLSTTLPFAPKYNFSLGVQYRFDLGSDASITPRIDVSRVARQFTSLVHDALAPLPARTLVNLRATYERGDWTAEAFATNLGDKAYPVGRTANLWTYGAPRQVGVRLGRKF